MPNGHGWKEYGGHQYVEGATSDCALGCGCWMGPCQSGGPTGLDPFGKCPKNPSNGKLLGENRDYDYVVKQRIEDLTSRLHRAEELLQQVSPGQLGLAKQLSHIKAELTKRNQILAEIRCLLEQLTT